MGWLIVMVSRDRPLAAASADVVIESGLERRDVRLDARSHCARASAGSERLHEADDVADRDVHRGLAVRQRARDVAVL